MNIIPNDYPPE